MTPPDERDQSVERWLERRPSGNAAPTDACLDAETAAAWVDGGLSAAATAQAEMHVAECPRCQAFVGVVVRTTEQSARPEPASSWRRWWTWAVPIGAAATALVALSVWLNVRTPPLRRPGARRTPSPRLLGVGEPRVPRSSRPRATLCHPSNPGHWSDLHPRRPAML